MQFNIRMICKNMLGTTIYLATLKRAALIHMFTTFVKLMVRASSVVNHLLQEQDPPRLNKKNWLISVIWVVMLLNGALSFTTECSPTINKINYYLRLLTSSDIVNNVVSKCLLFYCRNTFRINSLAITWSVHK